MIVLLVGTAVLLAGESLMITLLPIRAVIESFSTTWIGWMGSAYFAGFAIGCLIGPPLVRDVGHIRVFAGFAALVAAAAVAFPLLIVPFAWLLFRGFTGVCAAALAMVIESWLNELSNNQNRGTVLSVYIIIANLMTMVGQLMVNLYDPAGMEPFILITILVCVSLVPLSLLAIKEPTPPPTAKVRVGALYRTSPVGFLGALIVGLVDGAFWTLGPVFAQERGLPVIGITLFMSTFVLGGTLAQWPLGRLSDKIDRRIIIAGCCVGTIGTGLALAFLPTGEGFQTFVIASLHGAFMIPLYALVIAHANDFVPRKALVETSSALLLVYGIGASIGPLVVAPLMEHQEGHLFTVIVVLFAALGVFVFYRMFRRPISKTIERVAFVPAPKTSQAFYELEQDDEPLKMNENA